MERKLAAILAADVVGYSRLMEQDEADTFQRLRAHRKDVFEPEIEKHHGRVFKLMGDGLLAEFGSVVDAVECAVSLQRSMAERNAALEEERRIDVRIGINLGEVIVEGEDRYGEGVNIAARLQELAEPGGICVSGKVSKEVERKLAFGFEPIGEQQVKNIAEPVSVFRVKFEGSAVRRPVKAARLAGRTWERPAILALAILCVAGAGIWWMKGQSKQAPVFDKPSIAVLPFANLNKDPKWDRFADGITEDIITDLSHSKDLFVIARNSVEGYKGKALDIRQLGQELGVKYALEGSIQVIGDQIRVTAQLIDTESGAHVWSERYDRPSAQIFEVQTDVTEKIAATIAGYEGALAEAQRSILHRKKPENLAAFDYYLLGMEAKHSLTKEGFFKAEELFNKALALDPNLARAYVGLVYDYAYFIDYGLTSAVSETLDKMLAAGQKAVALDPQDGETHLGLGLAMSYRGEFQKALAEFRRAEELAPNDADLLLISAWTSSMVGEPTHAVQLAERAIQLNPHYPAWYLQGLRTIYLFGRQFGKSLDFAKQIENPFAIDFAIMAIDSAYLGDSAGAKSATSHALRLDPNWSAEQWISSQGGFPRDEDTDLFANGAEKAGLPMCVSSTKLKDLPNLIRTKACDDRRAIAPQTSSNSP